MRATGGGSVRARGVEVRAPCNAGGGEPRQGRKAATVAVIHMCRGFAWMEPATRSGTPPRRSKGRARRFLYHSIVFPLLRKTSRNFGRFAPRIRSTALRYQVRWAA